MISRLWREALKKKSVYFGFEMVRGSCSRKCFDLCISSAQNGECVASIFSPVETLLKKDKPEFVQAISFSSSQEMANYLKSNPCPKHVYNHLIRSKSNQCYPDVEALHLLAQFFSFRGHEHGLQLVKNICCISAPKEFQKYSAFSHYSAQLLWMNGNMKKGMEEFIRVSEENLILRREISGMMSNLVRATLPRLGKASIKLMEELSIKYSHATGDLSLLFIFWYSLFTSQWNEDQCQSLRLLLEHKSLRDYLQTRVTEISKQFLFQHNLVDYQRLLESLLQCNMDQATAQLLRALFDYYYKMGYTKGCRAVVKCCEEIDVVLTLDQIYRYQLLTGVKKLKENPILNIFQGSNPGITKYKF